MTLQEIFKSKGRKADFDNRNYYVRSINKVLNTGLVDLQVATLGNVFIKKNGSKYDFRVSAAGWYRHVSGSVDPETILRQIGLLLNAEEVKKAISSNVILHDNTCSKCRGKGIIPAFMHVCKGVCFDCLGLGVNVHTPKDIVKIK